MPGGREEAQSAISGKTLVSFADMQAGAFSGIVWHIARS